MKAAAAHIERTNGRYIWAGYVARLVIEEGYASTLEYDTTLAAPKPADLVVCIGVLEHVGMARLDAVLCDLARLAERKLFFAISTKPSDAHPIVRQHDWWHRKLSRYFVILTWEVRDGLVYGEAFPLSARPHKKFKRPAKRRNVTPQILAMFDHIRAQAAKYQDATTQIETIRMFEGVGDEPADMQVAYDLIEHWPDPDEALLEMCSMSRVGVMAAVRLGDGRTEGDWRKIFERRLRIADWHREGNQILVIGSPMVGVCGVTAVGAVAEDELWEPVKAAAERFKKRIEPAEPHGRVAVLACYGPSLAGTMDILAREAADPNADVVSVSAAHDFLLGHGIAPRYHVECDPRPHKADNIKAMCPATTYMLASCVSPVLFDKLGPDADIRLWHIANGNHGVRLVDEYGESGRHVITGGGSVGLRAIPLLYTMGYRKFRIFAMDCSYSEDGKQWAGAHVSPANKKKDDAVRVQCDGRVFITSPTLSTYATDFWEQVQKLPDINIRLYGDGLLQAMARYFQSAPSVAHVTTDTESHNEPV